MLLSSTAALVPGGTGQLTDSAFNGKSLANVVGLTAAVPVLNGQSIVYSLQNTGTHTLTVGFATYTVPTGKPLAVLSNQILVGVQYFTIPKGCSLTVNMCDTPCTQDDVFINKVDCTTVSDVVTNFSTFASIPSSNAAPPVDAGYNVAYDGKGFTGQNLTHNLSPTSTGSTPTVPKGSTLLGTLVAYSQTVCTCASGCGDSSKCDTGSSCGDSSKCDTSSSCGDSSKCDTSSSCGDSTKCTYIYGNCGNSSKCDTSSGCGDSSKCTYTYGNCGNSSQCDTSSSCGDSSKSSCGDSSKSSCGDSSKSSCGDSSKSSCGDSSKSSCDKGGNSYGGGCGD